MKLFIFFILSAVISAKVSAVEFAKPNRDFYSVLGVTRDASDDEIKKAILSAAQNPAIPHKRTALRMRWDIS